MQSKNGLQFDVSAILQRAKVLPKPKVKGVSINFPFISVELTASNDERKIAKEVLIRLRDKRVLVAWECCDSCVRNALASIQDIRALLVDKQVELGNQNSALFLVFDLMLTGIRQFLTFVEKLETTSWHPKSFENLEFSHVNAFIMHREEYLGALETLRGHLLRCIEEIAKIGNTSPQLSNRLNFNPKWEKELYITESQS
jgi:hypothetical protein